MTEHILATQEGIKSVGVGKRGSRELNADLLVRIVAEIRGGLVPDVVKGAFLAGLVMKGPTDAERSVDACFEAPVLDDPERMVATIAAEAPPAIQLICQSLLCQQELSAKEALTLGRFLMSSKEGDGARGLAASVLRVRYETPEEYAGLLQSLAETFEPSFVGPVPLGKPLVTLAEPFDGVDRSYMITPLVMRFLQADGYRVLGLCGRNSGPKYGNNLLEIARGLGATFLKCNADLLDTVLKYGWFLDQKDLSPAMDRWVDLRQQIIKRPFMATLERFVNPCSTRVMLASAFHPPYGDKMLTICERAGYPAGIIVRNGMEGTLAFPLIRQARILCTVRQEDGTYVRREILFDAQRYLGKTYSVEERLDNPSLDENIRLIQSYAQDGQTDYAHFDDRVKVTCAGLKEALEWIKLYRSG